MNSSESGLQRPWQLLQANQPEQLALTQDMQVQWKTDKPTSTDA